MIVDLYELKILIELNNLTCVLSHLQPHTRGIENNWRQHGPFFAVGAGQAREEYFKMITLSTSLTETFRMIHSQHLLEKGRKGKKRKYFSLFRVQKRSKDSCGRNELARAPIQGKEHKDPFFLHVEKRASKSEQRVLEERWIVATGGDVVYGLGLFMESVWHPLSMRAVDVTHSVGHEVHIPQ